MTPCVQCQQPAVVRLSWTMSRGPQSGAFCRACARATNSLLAPYGLTVTPLEPPSDAA